MAAVGKVSCFLFLTRQTRLGLDKIGFELFAADFISLLVEGIVPKAGQVINIIKVYLPMESITWDGFPMEVQKWNVSVSREEVMRLMAVINVSVGSLGHWFRHNPA